MLAIHVMHACIYSLFSYLFIISIGVVIAVKGFVDESGVFSVSDWTFCNAVTPAPLSTTTTTTTTTSTTTSATTTTFDHQHHNHLHHTAKSTYLLLVSGIEIGNITIPSTATTADDNNNNNPPVLPPISSSSSELSVQLLIDYVAGRLPSQSAIDLDIASKIVR